MSYYVSRQHYYYQNAPAVEVAVGGINYSGCDMLVTNDPDMRRLEGEYNDPREAIASAIELVKLWQQDKPYTISLYYGYNLDMIEGETISSDGYADGGEEYSDEEMDIIRFQEAREWAEKEFDSLDKCAYCGDILPDKRNRFYLPEFQIDGEEYCSENCADQDYYAICEANEIAEYEED